MGPGRPHRRLPPGSVTPFGDNIERPAFHVVRLENGELLALSAQGVIHRSVRRVVSSGLRLGRPSGLVPRYLLPVRVRHGWRGGERAHHPAEQSRPPGGGGSERRHLRQSARDHAGHGLEAGGLRIPGRRREGGRGRPVLLLQALNAHIEVSPEEADIRVEVPLIKGDEGQDFVTTARTWELVFRTDQIERVPLVVTAQLPRGQRRSHSLMG